MIAKYKNSILNILLFCIGFGLFVFGTSLSSFAETFRDVSVTVSSRNGDPITSEYGYTQIYSTFNFPEDKRVCLYLEYYNTYEGLELYTAYLYSNFSSNISEIVDATWYPTGGTPNNSRNTYSLEPSELDWGFYKYYPHCGNNNFILSPNNSGYCPIFYDIDDVRAYIDNGTLPTLEYHDDLMLDDFRVSDGQYGPSLFNWETLWSVEWSDSRIHTVKVNVIGTKKADSFITTNNSPFMGIFKASDYANRNGDVINMIATPYKHDGSYGTSLYYSFVYNGNSPLSNFWAPRDNNNFVDNTIEIPFTGVSNNNPSNLPVSGVTSNNVYKIHYNPQTEEITSQYFYNTYYSPVVVFPETEPDEDTQAVQEYVTNNYTTNNYTTINNYITKSVDFDINNISGNDVGQTYDDFGDFFKGIAKIISKIADLFSGLFPFLSPVVSVVLVAVSGIVFIGAIVILFLKIFHIL